MSSSKLSSGKSKDKMNTSLRIIESSEQNLGHKSVKENSSAVSPSHTSLAAKNAPIEPFLTNSSRHKNLLSSPSPGSTMLRGSSELAVTKSTGTQSISDFLEKFSVRVMGSDPNLYKRSMAGSMQSRTTRTNSQDTTSKMNTSSAGVTNNELYRGEGIVFDDKFLGLFESNHSFRLFMHNTIVSRNFNIFMSLLILLNWAIYLTVTWPKGTNTDYPFGSIWQHWCLIIIFIFYSLEMLAKIMTYGFVTLKRNVTKKHKVKAYWDDSLHILDTVCIISYWINIILLLNGNFTHRIFQAFSAIRPFRFLALTQGLSVMARSITSSAALLKNILIFLLFFYFFFGIMGNQFFSESLARRCVMNAVQPDGSIHEIFVSPARACGSFIDQNGTVRGPVGSQSAPKGYTCPKGQTCKIVNTFSDSPLGFLSYDYLPISMFTLFIQVTEQGWTDLMYRTMDAEYGIAFLYHVFVILIIDLVLMNMLIAVISETFSTIRNEYHEKLKIEKGNRRILQEGNDGWTLGKTMQEFQESFKYFKPALLIRQSFVFKLTLGLACCFSVFCPVFEKNYKFQLPALKTADIILWIFFVFELFLNYLVESSFKKFFMLKQRLLDILIIVITFVMLLPNIYGSSAYEFLSIFQIIRFYKVIPLIPRIPKIIHAAFGNIVDLFNAFVFFILMMAIFATVSMQMYGGRFGFLPLHSPSMNYDSFPEAFMSVFEIMVSDNWTDVLYSSMLSTENRLFGFFVTCVFYIVMFTVVHWIVVALAVAVSLQNFELDDEEKRYGQILQLLDKFDQKDYEANKGFMSFWNPHKYLKAAPELVKSKNLPANLQPQIKNARFFDFMKNALESKGKNVKREIWLTNLQVILKRLYLTLRPNKMNIARKLSENAISTTSTASMTSMEDKADPLALKIKALVTGINKNKENSVPNPTFGVLNPVLDEPKSYAPEKNSSKNDIVQEFKENHPYYDTSYFMFKPEHPLRRLCKSICTKRKGFDLFRLILIMAVIGSTIMLAVDTPLSRKYSLMSEIKTYVKSNNITLTKRDFQNPSPDLQTLMQKSEYLSQSFIYGEYVFVSIFTFEFIVRTISDGLILTPNAYLHSLFNCIDTIVLIAMWLGLTTRFVGATGIPRIIRIIRTLRPLRLITLSDELQSLFNIVLASLPQAFNLILLLLFFMIPYASYGVILFSGIFKSCNDPSVASKEVCVGYFVDSYGVFMPRAWKNYGPHFDNFFEALLTLFMMMFQEGWANIQYKGMSALGSDYQPEWPPIRWYNVFYFQVWMLFGLVLLKNLFVGVILQTFMTKNGTALLTNEQRQFLDLQRKLKLVKPSKRAERPLHGVLRQRCFDVVQDKYSWFHKITFGAMILNLMVVGTDYVTYTENINGFLTVVPMNQIFTYVKEFIYVFVCLVYFVEFLVKLLGFGWKKWKQNKWNLFDLFVLTGLLPILLLRLYFPRNTAENAVLLQFQKFFLDLSILKLVRRVSVLHMLFKTIASSFRSILNIFIVLSLVFVVYTLIAVEVFGLTRFGSVTNTYANFREFGTAILTFFRITTGERWNDIMQDSRVEFPSCVVNNYTYLLSDCGSSSLGLVIFISFQIIVSLILMSLFIVSVIDNFDFSQQEQSNYSILRTEDLSIFKRLWAELDPESTGFISRDSLGKLFRKLSGKLEMKIYDSEFSIQQILLKCYQNQKTGSIKSETLLKTEEIQKLHSSIRQIDLASKGEYRFDLALLNSYLATIDVTETRRRRASYNFVYQEALLHEEPGKGISFNKLLRILAYRLVDTEHFLKLEQLFSRQHEVALVQERVYKEKLKALFKTYAIRKRYKILRQNQDYEQLAKETNISGRHRLSETHSKKDSMGRMTEKDIPTIIVDFDDKNDAATTTISQTAEITGSKDDNSILSLSQSSRISWKGVITAQTTSKPALKNEHDSDDEETTISSLTKSNWHKIFNKSL